MNLQLNSLGIFQPAFYSLCSLDVFLGKNKVDESDKVSRTTKAEISDSDVFKFRSFHQHISVTTSSEYGSLSTATTNQHRYGDHIIASLGSCFSLGVQRFRDTGTEKIF